jgi:hypothetical protein
MEIRRSPRWGGLLDIEDGRITAVHLIRNPDKLGNVAL